jgi:hypothetical protein
MKMLLFLLFPAFVFTQTVFNATSGTSIVGINDPIITLYNANLQNGTGNNALGSGTIWNFTGNVSQSITGTYISQFYGLRLHNTAGFTLQSNTTISNRLDMITGDIASASYMLQLGTSASNPGTLNWTSGTVIGPLKRWFAASTNSTQASGIFPIGNNSTNRYFTINYTQSPTTGGYIIGEYKTGVPTQTNAYNGFPLYASDGQIVQNYANDGYFEITPYDYNSSLNQSTYTIKMRGIGITTVNDNTSVRLVKNPGPSHTGWVPCGSHSSVTGTNSDFTITSTGVTGFSWFNFGGGNDNPLPVELLYFEGTAYPLFNILKWSTFSEHNSSYFDLERSIDGENWKHITTKQAAGNSNSTLNYSHIDYAERVPLYYYRLNQFDIDGKSKMYGPIVIQGTSTKRVVKYINLAGQEVPPTTTGIIFEVYEDGTSKRILR